MPQIIEIENGLVSLIEKSLTHQIPLADWIAKIEKRSPITTPTLPIGTRAVYWNNTNLAAQDLTLLIEREPHIMQFNYGGLVRPLSLPWTRFYFHCTTADPTNNIAWHLENYQVFFSKKKYSSELDRDMIAALLPNVYSDGRICFGSTGANAAQSIADRLDQTVNEFFLSEFNSDLHIRRPNQSSGWRQWLRMTTTDPTGWMNWQDWDQSLGWHGIYSFQDLAGTPSGSERFSPIIGADPIPEIPLGASFGRTQEWLDTLDTSQRSRLLETMLRDRALNNERYGWTPEPTDDDD